MILLCLQSMLYPATSLFGLTMTVLLTELHLKETKSLSGCYYRYQYKNKINLSVFFFFFFPVRESLLIPVGGHNLWDPFAVKLHTTLKQSINLI